MAGDWIKMRMDLPEDPAVYKISALTKLDRLSVVGRLYAFWAWADKHAVDGRVDGATSHVVDDVTRHDGFADALTMVKWLQVGDDYIQLPNHERHNGESAKERGLKNARQARWREGNDKTSSTAVDAPSSTAASTREEKRREEKSNTKEKSAKAPSTPKPDDVDLQVWTDWVQLRKAKRATVSPTVIDEARGEAGKAGLSLERFLSIWCARGSQGLQAEWLKANERAGSTTNNGKYAAAARTIFGNDADNNRRTIDA